MRTLSEISKQYDEAYFEYGIESLKSNYANYRWLPEKTIPLARAVTDYAGLKRGASILDFGCAKGYTVKAFRQLGYKAVGLDVSEYAIQCASDETNNRAFCSLYDGKIRGRHDLIYCKDTLEHLRVDELDMLLEQFAASNLCWIVVPLGVSSGYFCKPANLDTTHIICETEVWWLEKFSRLFTVKLLAHRLPGIEFRHECDYGVGIFLLESRTPGGLPNALY